MAKIRFVDGGERNLKPDVALSVWEVLSGRQEPTSDQEKYVAQISKIYLNYHTAPDDYIKERFDIIVQLHFADWMIHRCDSPYCPRNGTLTRPDPARQIAVEFARKWGLIHHGVITQKAKKYLELLQRTEGVKYLA
jgi:hypothetical protein